MKVIARRTVLDSMAWTINEAEAEGAYRLCYSTDGVEDDWRVWVSAEDLRELERLLNDGP